MSKYFYSILPQYICRLSGHERLTGWQACFGCAIFNISRIIFILLLIIFFVNVGLFAQSQQYVVEMAPFSTRTNDEFSPVFYKGGIVFCSNQRDNSLVSYKDENSRLFKIYYVSKKNISGWNYPKLLAKEITTNLNDGPVTFNENENIMYYSRNNSIDNSLKNITDTSNKLGIYSAELINGTWTNIKPFTYNNPLYSLFTPALTPDGKRIYFSSDMPGGLGGMDIYYCNWCDNDWCEPVNMGEVVNTPGNESFPFADRYGKLFFASDGHKGFGGMDLFYTIESNGEWIVPVNLDSAINSIADDFGLVMDSTSRNGYFSTNRLKTDDIFSFSAAPLEFANCDTLQENNYCFTFYDEQHQSVDSLPLIYEWDFGNGIIRSGAEVKHCFPGPGEYSVRLSIIDQLTGDAIAKQVEYKVNLDQIEQAYINSYNVGIVNQPIVFDAIKSNLKDFIITDYLWDFGDGFKPGTNSNITTFVKKGEHTVRLGLLAAENSQRVIQKTCVMKKIRIYDSFEELAPLETGTIGEQYKTMQISILLMDDLSARQKVKIRESFKDKGRGSVRFEQYGITTDSYPFLDKVAGILKNNKEIRLEIVMHAVEDELQGNEMGKSEKWAQELDFYLKNKEIDKAVFRSKGPGLSHQFIKPMVHAGRSGDGIIEFIFMKR